MQLGLRLKFKLYNVNQIHAQSTKMNFQFRTLIFLVLFTGVWLLFLAAHEGTVLVFYNPLRGKPSSQIWTNAESSEFDSSHKRILIWNSANRIETAAFGFANDTFKRNQCPVHDCSIHVMGNATLPLESYDAIIIHIHEMWKSTLPNFTRRADQRLILLTQESPSVMNLNHVLPINPTLFINYFNWTMTYKSDADIPLRYGRIRPRSKQELSQETINAKILATHTSVVNYARNKNKSVAWMVSHCKTASQRELYVEELRNYIDVVVYGKCGRIDCVRNEEHWLSDSRCYKMLEQNYKFYISFENSICSDYVTEKFFSILQYNIVPVVYGGADYSQIAPVHSYIDASKYTAKELANYLHQLNDNDTLYNEYFWWKDHYDIEAGVEQMARHAFCDLCAKLHEPTEFKSYSSHLVDEWWNKTLCRPVNSTLFSSRTSS